MPSKRTNDSVDRIIEELNRKQADEGIRAGMNDQQVDEILRSIGLGADGSSSATVQFGPISEVEMPDISLGDATMGFSLTEEQLRRATAQAEAPAPAEKPAPAAPARPAPQASVRRTAAASPVYRPVPEPKPKTTPAPQPEYRPAPAPVARPASRPAASPAPAAVPSRPAAVAARPVEQPRPAAEPLRPRSAPQRPAPSGSEGDTTRTGVIKKFLIQAMEGEAPADSTTVIKRKEQFQRFFEESAAVLPDEKGRLQQPGQNKKRRGGLFGFGNVDTGESTEEFVPINVSLSGKKQGEPAADPYDLDETQDIPESKRKKRGWFGRRKKADEELVIPEPREEPSVAFEEEPAPEAVPTPAPPVEQKAPAQETYYRSKYTRRTAARPAVTPPVSAPIKTAPVQTAPVSQATLTDETLALLRQTVTNQKTNQKTQEKRKKPDTVEFTPGQEPRAPAVAPPPVNLQAEPAAEPIMAPNGPVRPQSVPQQEERPRPAPAQAPAAAPESTPAPAEQPPVAEESVLSDEQLQHSGFTVHMDAIRPEQLEKEISTGEITADDIRLAADEITRTITGQIRLDKVDPGQPMENEGNAADLYPNEEAPAEENPADTSNFVRDIANSINSNSPQAARLTEAARQLTEEMPKAGARKGAGGKFRLNGLPKDEQEDDDTVTLPFAAPRTDRAHVSYEKGEDAPVVHAALDKRVLLCTVNTIVTGVLAAVLIYLGTAAAASVLPMPAPLDPLVAPGALLGVCLALLGVAAGISWQTMVEGMRGLVRSPTPDTLPTLATAACVVQLVVYLIKPELYQPASRCLLAGAAALLLCFNNLGKVLDARTVRDNFDLVSAGVDHAVAYRLRESRVVNAVTKGLSEPKPSVLVSRPTQLLKSFLKDSYSHRTSDKNQQQFAWILGAGALVGLIFNLVASKDIGKAVTAMAGVLCLGAPLAGTLLSALPVRLMQRSAARVGAVIPGWKDIRQLGRTNVVQLTARDIFPSKCLKLHGIKTFRKERIDLAIVYTASILVDACPTLRDVFLSMIGDSRKLLHKVDDLRSVPGKGYVGWIDGSRVLVGNRALMQKYDIQIPAAEYEQRFTVNQRKIIYLAVSGNLFSMFLVSYERDNDTAAVLENLHKNGISFIVSSDDFNCDANLVETVYTLPSGSVNVLGAEETEVMAPAVAWLPESDGCMLHLGNFASFVGGLEAAAGAAEGERKAGFVLTASVLISCVLGIVMSLTGGIASLALPAMVLYQAGWAALALIFPLLQKY